MKWSSELNDKNHYKHQATQPLNNFYINQFLRDAKVLHKNQNNILYTERCGLSLLFEMIIRDRKRILCGYQEYLDTRIFGFLWDDDELSHDQNHAGQTLQG